MDGTMDGINTRGPIGYGAFSKTFEPNIQVVLENIGSEPIVDPYITVNGKRNWRSVKEILAEILEEGMNLGTFYLGRDNSTILSNPGLVRDHDLTKRTHNYGILARDNRDRDEFVASLYVSPSTAYRSLKPVHGHQMTLTLRPGEALVYQWDNIGKFFGRQNPKRWKAWHCICNGKLIYRPLKRASALRKIAESAVNVELYVDEANQVFLRSKLAGKRSTVLFSVRSPYVMIGARLNVTVKRLSEADTVRAFISFDRKHWIPVWEASGTGVLQCDEALDRYIDPNTSAAKYAYFVRFEFLAKNQVSDVLISDVLLDTDIQMAPLSLPALELGRNAIRYTDKNTGPRQIRITYVWQEDDSNSAPVILAKPIFPPDGERCNGLQPLFDWPDASDADGDTIADYHFQLSDRPDMRWPLSGNFNKLMSRTLAGVKSEWRPPYNGLLNPGTRYYWRVRPRDERGLWGVWSPVWSFVPDGPGVPIDLQKTVQGRTIRISWKPNPQGATPMFYELYGSNEQGFSISKEAYEVRDLGTVEANFITTSTSSTFTVVDAKALHPNMNRVFYRIVAVDQGQVRSGPSDFIELDHPFIYSRPVTMASPGAHYAYQVKSLCSIGDLRCRWDKGKYFTGFWNKEELQFLLVEAPEWLRINSQNGLISGILPVTEGEEKTNVAVEVVNKSGQAVRQRFTIQNSLGAAEDE